MSAERLRQPYLLALMGVCLAGFALRVYVLDGQSLWYDEGVTATVAARGFVALTHWTAGDIQPPLYYYVVAGWGGLSGWSEWSLRFPSAFFGTLTIPLLAVTARRLTARRAAALLAALFAALHPLLLYYSQEARMYAMLVAVGVLVGYLALRAIDVEQRQPNPAWLGYVLFGVVAVYTHYFAFFLLLGVSLAAALVLAGRREARGVVWLLLSNVAILVLYLPWLNVMWQQLGGDRSYWTGALKLHEAVQNVAISFTSGETVVEGTARWLLLLYATVTTAAVVGLWRAPAAGRRTLLVALCWLLVPLLAILALATAVPKFNARYAMVALPGLLLVWSGGLAMLRMPSRRVLASLLLLGFAFALVNWYFHPNFAKDDWRGLTAWLRARLAPDEVVVLVSGHAWPVWEYYAPDIPVVQLPALEILDVDEVLTFEETGPPLRAAFANELGKQGAWLVNWQDEVVDPNGIVPAQLELGGREKGQSVIFAGINLRRFNGIRASRIAEAPPVDHPVGATAGGRVTLVGYKALNNGDLLLFWQRPEPFTGVADDLRMALESYAGASPLARPTDRRLGGYTYPSSRWQAGEVVTGVIPAREWLGEEPQGGTYRVKLRVYDADDQAALGWDDGRAEIMLDGIEVIID